MRNGKAMDSVEPKKQKISHSNHIAYIHIVGMNKLQNELLLSFLKEKIGCTGICEEKLEPKAPSYKDESELSNFHLMDWNSIDSENIWSNISSWKKFKPVQCFFAFYNVDPEVKIEKMALANNIHGLFYKNDPLHMIPKGIFSILRGDLWYSRKTLTKFVLEPSASMNYFNHVTSFNLTMREREILTAIVSGLSNKSIANNFCISVNTVKTHTYNIYKKINVNNRFQAMLWATKYLSNR